MIPLALGLIGKVAAAAVLPRVVTAVCDLVRGAENHRDSVRERCTDETSNRNNPVNFVDPDGLEAGIVGRDGSYQHFPGTNEGWTDFVHTIQNAAPGSVQDILIFGHGSSNTIYPARYPGHANKDSYIWHNRETDSLIVRFLEDGVHYDIPFERLGLHRLKPDRIVYKGCHTARTKEDDNLTKRTAKILPKGTKVQGSTDFYYFDTNEEKKDLRLRGIQWPRTYRGQWGE